MSQAKHTPGPWVATSKAIVSGRTNIMHRPKWWHEGLLEAEDNANARLIAAAPELLDALCTLLNRLDGIGGEHVTGMEGVDADLMKANAAIAKATGEAK